MAQVVELKREIISNQATLGRLFLGGTEVCKTLENPWLNNLSNVSCIPCGKYEVEPFTGSKYKDVWQVLDVANRSYILIHVGNREKDTRGCILVGKSYGFLSEKLAVLSSRDTLNKLKQILPSNFILKISEAMQ
jgi:hypothetical protein